MDIPLQPGTRKEFRLSSNIGYVDQGLSGVRFLNGNAPPTRADLYCKSNVLGDWTKFSSIDLLTDFRR